MEQDNTLTPPERDIHSFTAEQVEYQEYLSQFAGIGLPE